MTNKQAIEYIHSLIGKYNSSTIKDPYSIDHRYVAMWMSREDIEALQMAIAKLKEQTK